MEPEQAQEPPIDIEAYAANYVSHAKTDRLLFIAAKSASTPLEAEAVRLAAQELKKGRDTGRYLEVAQRAAALGGPPPDRAWAEATERTAAAEQDRLESELAGYKTNLIKESIRLGNNDLGDHFYSRGDLQNAFKSYVRTRDYCTTSKHIVQMCLNIIKVGIELKNYIHVNNYVQKAEQTPDTQKDPVVMSKLRCAAGLAALDGKKYKLAARKFTEVSSELGQQYHDVISAADVATYGALAGLAALDRSELRQRLIDSVHFRELLELVPQVREVVNDFYAARYAACLVGLERLRPALHLDPHAAPHLPALYAAVRSKALVQYTAPFSSVDLTAMASAFQTDVSGLERELAELITSGQVAARIDSHAKLLYARHANQRCATFSRALATTREYVRETKGLLLRASLLQHDVVQRASPALAVAAPGPPGARGGHRLALPQRSD